jgi:hypothetical protein
LLGVELTLETQMLAEMLPDILRLLFLISFGFHLSYLALTPPQSQKKLVSHPINGIRSSKASPLI